LREACLVEGSGAEMPARIGRLKDARAKRGLLQLVPLFDFISRKSRIKWNSVNDSVCQITGEDRIEGLG